MTSLAVARAAAAVEGGDRRWFATHGIYGLAVENDRIPRTDSDLVLVGVKARLFGAGLRPALTPTPCELARQAAAGPTTTEQQN
jgi:hypothetical protein